MGTYQVSVEAPGFRKYVRNGIIVQVAETARVDIPLEVGSTSDSVVVTADASQLKTESAEQSTTLTGDTINALPLNFGTVNGGSVRNLLGIVTLSPGTWSQPSTPSNGWNNNIRVNGMPNISFGARVDGQDSTGGITPQMANVTQPSIDSIQEFTLQTSNFAAEYGNVGGGCLTSPRGRALTGITARHTSISPTKILTPASLSPTTAMDIFHCH